MVIQPDFALLSSICTGGFLLATILLAVAWNLGTAARGLLRLLGLMSKIDGGPGDD